MRPRITDSDKTRLLTDKAISPYTQHVLTLTGNICFKNYK